MLCAGGLPYGPGGGTGGLPGTGGLRPGQIIIEGPTSGPGKPSSAACARMYNWPTCMSGVRITFHLVM